MTRPIRLTILVCCDIGCIIGSMLISALLLGLRPSDLVSAVVVAVILRVTVKGALGAYRTMLRYAGLHALVTVCVATIVGTLGAFVVYRAPAAFYALEALLTMMACGGFRVVARLYRTRRRGDLGERIAILGAGTLGEETFRSLLASGHQVLALMDDDPRKIGALIHGRRVIGPIADLPIWHKRLGLDLAVIAIRDLPQSRLKDIFHLCMTSGLRVKLLKGVDDFIDASRLEIEDLHLEDLLRRPPRNLDRVTVRAMLTDKVVLVTGAGGSIGSEICRQVCDMGARRLIMLDHSEFGLYEIDTQLRESGAAAALVPILATLTDRSQVQSVLLEHRPDVVFHAAAYKHVPMVEANPCLGVLNNVGGTKNLVDAAVASGVERLVLISTDKAVRPTNIMGATKRVCELLAQNHPTSATMICAVRFGNVLGSSGSVIPRFLAQIAEGGPVTVTHPEITRYFMLIPEAVELVLQAAAIAADRELFILDMGQPIRIDDLARQLIFMSGCVPNEDIKIEYSGLRPGEKLFEELLIDDSERRTAIDGIMIARPTQTAWPWLEHRIDALLQAAARHDIDGLARNLRSLVQEWTPSEKYRVPLDERADIADKGAAISSTGEPVQLPVTT